MRPRAGISVAAIGLVVALAAQASDLSATLAAWLGLAFAAVGLLLAALAAGQSLPGDEPGPTDGRRE